MTTDTSWSKLLHTDMGEFVRATMDDPRLTYHNITHIERLYAKAKEWGLPYNRTLDGAILWHDAVYDADPDKEIRSADLAQQCARDNPQWFEHIDLAEMNAQILSTINHTVTDDVSPLMLQLDLAELADPVRRRVNFWDLLQEATNLYDVDIPTACAGTAEFIKTMHTVQYNNSLHHTQAAHGEFWTDVCQGCEVVYDMAHSVCELYAEGGVVSIDNR